MNYFFNCKTEEIATIIADYFESKEYLVTECAWCSEGLGQICIIIGEYSVTFFDNPGDISEAELISTGRYEKISEIGDIFGRW